MTPDGVMESCLYTSDLTAAEHFYHTLIGLEVIAREPGRHVFFRCGSSVVLIFDPAHTSTAETHVGGAPVPLHGCHGPGHLAFRVNHEALAGWRERLREQRVPIESEVHWPHGGTSLYFRDPAGNSLEFVTPDTWRNGPVPEKT
jgi:catechol 2,3-dioxygenase-like lactoylglutathione lyase family enzyme